MAHLQAISLNAAPPLAESVLAANVSQSDFMAHLHHSIGGAAATSYYMPFKNRRSGLEMDHGGLC